MNIRNPCFKIFVDYFPFLFLFLDSRVELLCNIQLKFEYQRRPLLSSKRELGKENLIYQIVEETCNTERLRS